MKKTNKHGHRHCDISIGLDDLENNNINELLSGEFKQIYKGVQKKCENFRDRVFSRNIKCGQIKNISKDNKTIDLAHQKLLLSYKTPQQLMEEFTKKAELIQMNKE